VLQRGPITFNQQVIEGFGKKKRSNVLRLNVRPHTSSGIEIYKDEDFASVTNHARSLLKIGAAILIQHCGEGARGLCGELLRKGAKIDLYVQDPASCVCQRQRDKLTSVHNDFESYLREDVRVGHGTLNIYRYDEPATIRAACIEGEILAVGWYTYYRALGQAGAIETNLKGHNRPMVILRSDEPAFDVLRQSLIEPVLLDLKAVYSKPWRTVS
jgi:hypothetical protein